MAERFRINVSSVYAWVMLARRTGDVVPGHGGDRQRLVDPEGEAVVWALLREHADATLPEVCQQLAKRTKLRVSQTTMCRVLQRMGVSRKKERFTRQSETGVRLARSFLGRAGMAPGLATESQDHS